MYNLIMDTPPQDTQQQPIPSAPPFPVVKGYTIDGLRYKQLSSGAVYDMQVGRIVAKVPSDVDITQANSSDMRSRYILKTQRVAREAIASGALRPGQHKGFYGGWHSIILSQAELAQDKRQGRSSTEAARFLMRAAGLDALEGPAGGGVTVQIGSEAAAKLLEVVQAVMERRK